MDKITFSLFGPPRLERADLPIPVNRRKTLALLAYLALTRAPHSREALAALFWPENDPSSALANLRRDLSRLKEHLGEGYLQIERDKVQIDPNADWSVDTLQFESLVQQVRQHGHLQPGSETTPLCQRCMSLLENAIQLYQGGFMAGFNLPDSPAFDDWQFDQNERLRSQLVEVLDQLIWWSIRQSAYQEAIEYARRWLALDPLHEPAQRMVMKLYAWSGQFTAAIRQYDLLVDLLERELGVEPEAETTALYKTIRSRRLPPPDQANVTSHLVEKMQPDEQAPAETPLNLQTSQRYSVESLLAQGGFGEIYQGHDRLTGKIVAIKRLHNQMVKQNPEMVERFKREREILSRLSHPNIVPMLDFYEQDGEYNLVMEYMPGGTLRDKMGKEPAMGLEQSLDLAIELADALSRAHHLHILHRDIKPENILLDSSDHPRLIDFGLALLEIKDTRLTQAGMLIGSPAYMSPEALRGQELDPSSDIWSFGVLLYELLAGRPPFESDQFHVLIDQIMHQTPPLLRESCPEIPPELERLVSQMLEKDRDKRLQSMRQAAAVLEAIRSGKSISEPTQPTPISITPWLSPSPEGLRLLELPSQPTPFVGRDAELQHLYDLLTSPDSRLVTLVGPGGIGKTRLAIETAARAAKVLQNGAVFIPLATITEVEFMLQAIGNGIHLRFSPGADPKDQLLSRLKELKLVLVLDNFEQLVPAADLLAEIIAAAPDIRLLVTSRERLNLMEEWVFELQGLPFPSPEELLPGETESWLGNFSAVQLFVDRARRVLPNLKTDLPSLRDIVRICQFVEGMPLALELAAPWVRVMSCQEIAQELERGLDLLTTTLRNLPERHRSIRVIFNQTWQSLNPSEQTMLARLSVFHNGCSREAAEAVAAARLPGLTALVDKALLRFRANRYEMHELVRQYAAERLAETPQQQETTYDQHHRYFLQMIANLTPWMKGGRQIEASNQLSIDFGNIHSAWQRAIQRKDFESVYQASDAYWLLHEFGGFLSQGEIAFRQAADAIEPGQLDHMRGFFLSAQGSLLARQWQFEQGRNLMFEGISLLRKAAPQNPTKLSFVLAWLAFLNVMHGQYPEGIQAAEESLSYFPQTGDQWTQAGSLRLLGAANLYQGKLQKAQEQLDQCVAVCKSIGELRIRTYATSNLGVIYLWYGEINQAREYFDEALRISKSCNDRLARADALCERARLFIATGEYDLAIENAQACITLYHGLGRTRISLANILLGKAMRLQGKAGAKELILEGLEAARWAGHRPDMASAYEVLGALASDHKEFDLADQYYRQSMEIWEEVGHEPEIGFILCRRAALELIRGRLDIPVARSQLLQALQMAQRHQSGAVALSALVGLEGLRVLSGEAKQANEVLSYARNHPSATAEVRRWVELFPQMVGQPDLLIPNPESLSTPWQNMAERYENSLA